jgi:elongation factor 2
LVKVKNAKEIEQMVQAGDYSKKRIFSITAHIDHGKTTTSDYLLMRAGLMREEDAGKLCTTDSDEEEKARGITIFTSVVLLSFEDERKKEDNHYIFQINDTPGHLSFTGEVSRALRCSDGAMILVDALEGIMTQTETNIRLSVGNERCKPVLFINKVDRLISELRLEPKEVGKKIEEVIHSVNNLIRQIQPPDRNWQVSLTNNSVTLGSAKDGWGFTLEVLKEKNIKFNYVFEKYSAGDVQWLRQNLPLHEPLLRMVIDHLPSPRDAAPYRLPHLAPNIDYTTPVGKALLASDPNGPLMGIISKIFIDPKSFRPTLIGRVFSGKLNQGDTIYLVNRKEKQKVKRLGVMEVTDLLDMEYIPAGNLFAIFGFICPAGETFVAEEMYLEYKDRLEEMPRFESIKYSCEAVVSRSIMPVNPEDLGKLGEVTSKWLMADNTARFKLNQESKEYILSGIDPLQIEILTKRINEQVKIKVGDPIIVYREMPTKVGQEFHTKSSNGHNRIRMRVEPLDQTTVDLIINGEINENMKEKEIAEILKKKANWDAKEAKRVWDAFEGNILLDATSGVQRLERIKSYVISAFREFCGGGPLAKEPVTGVKAIFTDATIHTDPAHTGYGEIATMTTAGLVLSFFTAEPKLFEPIQKVDVKVPAGYQGSIIRILNQHRGRIKEINVDGGFEIVSGELPASETVEIADEFRGATEGRSMFGYEFKGFEPIPGAYHDKSIMEIRKRKGLSQEMPSGKNFERFIYSR